LLQTYNRKITVRNTRLGALSAFEFLDTYNADLSISSTMGETLTSTANSLLLRLGPDDFMQIGWDGVFNGKPQPSEVYYYLVEVRVAGGVWRDQGDVTLVR
jgi:hypothetical protein